jgi:hypothetical protein
MNTNIRKQQEEFLRLSNSPLRLMIVHLSTTGLIFSAKDLDHIKVSRNRKSQMLSEAIKHGFLYKVGKLPRLGNKKTVYYALNENDVKKSSRGKCPFNRGK